MTAIANKATLTSTRMIAMALPSAPDPFVLGDPAPDHAEDQLARPHRALERERDHEADVDQPRELVRAIRHRSK